MPIQSEEQLKGILNRITSIRKKSNSHHQESETQSQQKYLT